MTLFAIAVFMYVLCSICLIKMFIYDYKEQKRRSTTYGIVGLLILFITTASVFYCLYLGGC